MSNKDSGQIIQNNPVAVFERPSSRNGRRASLSVRITPEVRSRKGTESGLVLGAVFFGEVFLGEVFFGAFFLGEVFWGVIFLAAVLLRVVFIFGDSFFTVAENEV